MNDIYGKQDHYVTILANGTLSATSTGLDNWNQAGTYSIAMSDIGTVDGSIPSFSVNKALQSVVIDLNTKSVLWANHMTGRFPIVSQTIEAS